MSSKEKATYISSYVSGDTLIELVYNKGKQQTKLAVFEDGKVTERDSIMLDGMHLKPISPDNSGFKVSITY